MVLCSVGRVILVLVARFSIFLWLRPVLCWADALVPNTLTTVTLPAKPVFITILMRIIFLRWDIIEHV
jgi:hypothetical protein